MNAARVTQARVTNNPITMDTMTASSAHGKNIMAAQTTCNNCYTRLFELKRQAMKCIMVECQKMNMGTATPLLENLPHIVYQHLQLSDLHLVGTVNGICTYCGMHLELIKQHALIQTTNFAPLLSRNMLHQNQIADFEQFNDNNMNGRPAISHGETTDTFNGKKVTGLNNTETSVDTRRPRNEPPARSPGSPSVAQFFTEAARKYNISNKKRSQKKEKTRKDDNDLFPTNFSRLLQKDPPANPPGLFKYMGRRVDGKVSVMLRISPNCQVKEKTDSFISVDQRRKQISVLQPQNLDVVPTKLQINNSANSSPKLYGFDFIFEPDMPQTRLSSSSVLDVLHAVINGGEGCLLVYGASGTGKTSTMVGTDSSNKELGILPSAISWLYSLLEDCKQRTGAKISVRVSAVEIVGCNENLRDLLSEQASGGDSTDSSGASPGIYLRENPTGGTVQLGNVSEPQAVSAEKAAFYLDAALASRTTERDNNGQVQESHMMFTIHVYQYRVERNHRRGPGAILPYSGGCSRLHLIDLSYVNSHFNKSGPQQQQHIDHCSSSTSTAPSHAGLGQIIVSLLNGFKQIPYRDSKITRLLKDSIGDLTCRSTIIIHVSDEEKDYSKTCSTLQLTSRINRSRRKRNKSCSISSDSSCDESGRRRRPHPAMVKTYGIEDCASSDYNTSSAGEDSCDTVIYMGKNGHVSDRDLTDNERPPSPDTFKAMRLKLPSSSEDEKPEPISIQPKNNVTLEPCKIVAMKNEPKKFSARGFSTRSTENSLEINDDNQQTCLTGCCDNVKIKSVDNNLPEENTDQTKTNLDLPPAFQKLSTSEKAINVVAPLIIKTELFSTGDSVPTASMSTDRTKMAMATQPIANIRCANETILGPESNGINENSEKVPSEKELRKRERRIAKLLKESLSLDDSSMEEVNNRKNLQKSDGYTSDSCHKLKKSTSIYDGYISAPENNYRKPVQIVRGRIRQQSFDETICEESKDDATKPQLKSAQQWNKESSDIEKSPDKIVVDIENRKLDSIKKDELKNRIDTWKKDIPKTCLDDPQENNHCSDCVDSSDNGSKTVTSTETKITDLSHVITVSNVPNFTVAKKEAFKDIVSTSSIRHNTTRGSILSLKYRLESDLNDSSCTPRFERSYSREDTCSLVSATESDAYDSDTYSSCTTSPAVSRRHDRTTRLRYRWSTVYEEDETKKDVRADRNSTPKNPKVDIIVVDNEPKPSRILSSSKKTVKSPKTDKKILSPRSERKHFDYDKQLSPKVDRKSPKVNKKSNNSTPLSPKSQEKKFTLLSPKSKRKNDGDKRMSACSDVSSGIGSSSSQTPSLRSNEEMRMDEFKLTRENSKSRLWPFGRSKTRKPQSSSGYVSDGNLTDSSVRSSRRYRFFSRSKSSMYSDGHSSGYDTSITEGGMTSCAEDLTDNESVSTKKRKRFLGFRRRSTNDLSSSRARVKKPLWLDSRHCQSDDEGLQIKVYEIDGPTQIHPRRRCKSEDFKRSRIQPRKLDDLKKPQEHLKGPPVFTSKYGFIDEPINADKKATDEMHSENGAIGKRFKVLKNHIQVVTCFDANTSTTQRRRVTQI